MQIFRAKIRRITMATRNITQTSDILTDQNIDRRTQCIGLASEKHMHRPSISIYSHMYTIAIALGNSEYQTAGQYFVIFICNISP